MIKRLRDWFDRATGATPEPEACIPPPPLPHQFTTIDAWLRRWVAHRLAYSKPGQFDSTSCPFGAGVPLIRSIGLDSAIAADGVVWIQSGLEPGDPWRPARPNERIALLISGARRRFPELAVLLPLRPVEATDCVTCNGTGTVLADIAWCWDCSERGWVVAGLDTRLELADDPA